MQSSCDGPLMLPDRTRLFAPGDECAQFVRVLSGSVRVDLLSRTGKPMLLYRIEPGGTCALTTMCLLSSDTYSAEAHTEGRTEIATMPASAFLRTLAKDAEFRAEVFASLGERISSLMARIDEVTSVPVGERLAGCLLQMAGADGTITATHQQLAAESGTSREVVSRKLGSWEAEGIIARARGSSKIVDAPRLRQLAGGGD